MALSLRHLVVMLGGLAMLLLATLPPAMADNAYRLAAGDRLRVTVFGEEDLSGEFELDGAGTFSMSLIGAIPAHQQTVRDLEIIIEDKLRDGFLVNPQVSVEVLNYRPFYIIGEVNNPGSYPYRAGLTVINAVALAGGFTYRADEDDIEITRGAGAGSKPTPVEREEVVLPGDVVRVNERFF